MTPYVVYLPSGQIVRSGHSADEATALIQGLEGEAVLINVPDDMHPNLHRVNLDVLPPALVRKQQIPFHLDGSTISNLPVGTIAQFEGERIQVDDGDITIESDLPGVYEILLQHPLYLDTRVLVTV